MLFRSVFFRTFAEWSGENIFSVYLIPETLRITTMEDKKIGDMINLEIETQTKNMVDLITEMKADK